MDGDQVSFLLGLLVERWLLYYSTRSLHPRPPPPPHPLPPRRRPLRCDRYRTHRSPRPRPGGKNPPRRAVPPRRLQHRRKRRRSCRPDGDAPPHPRHPPVCRRRAGPPGRGQGGDPGEEGVLRRTSPADHHIYWFSPRCRVAEIRSTRPGGRDPDLRGGVGHTARRVLPDGAWG